MIPFAPTHRLKRDVSLCRSGEPPFTVAAGTEVKAVHLGPLDCAICVGPGGLRAYIFTADLEPIAPGGGEGEG